MLIKYTLLYWIKSQTSTWETFKLYSFLHDVPIHKTRGNVFLRYRFDISLSAWIHFTKNISSLIEWCRQKDVDRVILNQADTGSWESINEQKNKLIVRKDDVHTNFHIKINYSRDVSRVLSCLNIYFHRRIRNICQIESILIWIKNEIQHCNQRNLFGS